MKKKKKITSNPKLFYSAPILSLHCTLMSMSIPAVEKFHTWLLFCC